MPFSFTTLKFGLLLFWAIWLSIVLMANVLEGLKALGVLPESWKFASQNLELIEKAVSIYSVTSGLGGLLFAGAVLWQAIAVWLYWAAVFTYPDGVLAAFAASLGLWAAFMLADEIFRRYETQSQHLVLLSAQLLTLLVITLLPG